MRRLEGLPAVPQPRSLAQPRCPHPLFNNCGCSAPPQKSSSSTGLWVSLRSPTPPLPRLRVRLTWIHCCATGLRPL